MLLAVLVVVATHESEERELARLLREAQPRWLLAAALLQALTYVCAAGVWQRALAYGGGGPSLRRLLPLGLAKLFTDQALPSVGMSGTLLVVRGLERRGVSRTGAVAAMLTGLVAFYLGYLIAILAAVSILWRHGQIRLLILLPVALVGALAAGTPLAIFALRRWAVRHPPRWLERWPGARDVADALRARSAGYAVRAAPAWRRQCCSSSRSSCSTRLTLDVSLRAVATPIAFPAAFASFVVASVGELAGLGAGRPRRLRGQLRGRAAPARRRRSKPRSRRRCCCAA